MQRRAFFSLLALAFLIGFSGRNPAVQAQAQPPERFYGSVKVNGADQGDGTVVEAYVGNTLCGSGTVENRNGQEIYLVDVLGGGQKAGCAKDGDKVTFKVSGLDANETGTYETAAATRLDLTASGTARPVEQPTVLAPGTGGTPAPPPTLTVVPPPPSTSTAAPATAAPTQSAGTPAAAPETPAAGAATPTPGFTVPLTATATVTPPPTAIPILTPAPVSANKSAGPSPVIWIVIVLVVLGIAAGGAAWFVQRRRLP